MFIYARVRSTSSRRSFTSSAKCCGACDEEVVILRKKWKDDYVFVRWDE